MQTKENGKQTEEEKRSTQIFKHNTKWYKLSLRIDETIVTPARDISEQK
jgi:hypothetical protein